MAPDQPYQPYDDRQNAPLSVPEIIAAGDRAYLIRYGYEISPAVNARVLDGLATIEEKAFPWVVDLVPAYASLLVVYDALQTWAGEVRRALEALVFRGTLEESSGMGRTPAFGGGRLVEIPVWYHPSVGVDLEMLAADKGMAPDDLADLHANVDYRVYALGFRPGFPFLGVVDARLATPRLTAPRPRIAAGSVGIAGRQTGIYPSDGPGGWRIIGRTPLAIFDLKRPQPFYLGTGDRVRFRRIDEADYRALVR